MGGKDERSVSPHKSFQAPENYETKHKTIGSDCKNITLRGKSREAKRDDKPGPGSYSPTHEAVKDRILHAHISKSQKKLELG